MSNRDKKPMDKKNKIFVFSMAAVLLVLLAVSIGLLATNRISQGALSRRLEAEGSDTIVIEGTVKINKSLVINGEKTIVGDGTIVLVNELAGEWPDDDKKNSWGMGCASLKLEETDKMAAAFQVSDGATLSLGGAVTLNASGNGNAICVANSGILTLTDKAVVQEGRYANVIVAEKATAELQGGSVKDSKVYGVINYGTLNISGGEHTGSEAVIYNIGTATQSDGVVAEATAHNVYVAQGTFTMTGGTNEDASKDGVIVQDGASADIKGGDIKNCVHGLCNSGKLNGEAVALSECGIMNYKTGDLTISGTTVDTAATYCLANNGGKVEAKNFTAKKCDTCAVYNFSGDMNLTDLTVSGSRDGNIGNGGGNLTVNGAKLEKCRDKSITVANGKAVFNNVTITGTSNQKYGVYVYGGECYMTKGTLSDISSSAVKVDAGGYVEVNEISLKDIAENVFHSDGGKIVAENVTAEVIGSHAVYNKSGEITLTNATIKDVEKNVIQQKGGTTTLKKVNADQIGNNGAYVELGSVVVKESTFTNMKGNGFYIIKGDNDSTLTNVTLDGVGKQGINNSSKVSINGLTVKNAVQNGIFNKESGTITAKNITISNAGEHGINNYNKMSVETVKISDTGKGSNGLQNKGTLTIKDVTVKNSKNHGVYNTGTIKGSDLEIKTVVQNGVYNDKGTFQVSKVSVDGAGEHGLNNAAKMTVSDVTINDTGKGKNSVQNAGTFSITTATLKNSKNHGIYNTGTVSGKDVMISNVAQNGVYNAKKGTIDEIKGLTVNGVGSHGINNENTLVVSDVKVSNTGKDKNGIQNSGKMTVKTAMIQDSGKHGLYSNKNFYGEKITLTNSGDLAISNVGDMEIHELEAAGTANKAIYNEGKAAFYNTTIDGTDMSVQHLVDNNGGELSFQDTTLKNAKGTALHNRGKATASVKNVVVDKAGNFGVFVGEEAGLSGEGLEINNVFKNADISEAEGIAIMNRGKITGLNRVTLGGDDVEVTGSGTVVSETIEEFSNSAIVNDTSSATFTSCQLVVRNVSNGCAFYNKGTANLTDVIVENPKDGIVSRYNGWTVLSGTITVTNAGRNPIRTYGDEDADYKNGIELTSEAMMMIDGAEGHAINNKGSFLAAEDTTITVKNVVGENINAINNNKGKMSLGNVTVDNTQVTIAMYDDETINSNSGNAIFTSGSLQLNGNTVISNIYTLPANNKTDNSNSSGVVVKNGGSITGKGNIIVNGNGTKEIDNKTYQGVYNGVFTTECVIDIDGDITVNTAKNQGVYVADANAKVDAKNITVSNVSAGNGVYISNTSGALNASGTITISNTAQRGIGNTQGGDVTAANIIVSNTTGDAINNGSGGTMIVSGSIQVSEAGGCGISMGGSTQLKAAEISVTKAGTIGIVNQGTIGGEGQGTVTVDMQNTGTYGIHNNGGTIYVASVTVKNTKDNGIHMEKEAVLQATTVKVEATKGQAIQLNHKNTLTVATMEIKNSEKNGLRLYNNNANPSVTIGKVIVQDCAERGIAAQKQITDANISISEVWYKNCAGGAVHGNVKSGVAEPQELTE